MNEINVTTKSQYLSEHRDFRIWLQQQFTSRCKRNPKYSLRAFAQMLKMDASSVSQIFAGKRKASTRVISKICDTLSAGPVLKTVFLNEAKAKFKNSKYKVTDKKAAFELLAEDAFAVISEWYHFAILELANVNDFKSQASWCANVLGISTAEAQIAIERLKRLSLMKEEDGRLIRTNRLLTNFKPGITSSAHKNLQRQILKMAIEAIDHVDAEDKDITCMTMAIDIKKIPAARKVISKFRRELTEFLEEGSRSQVYQLAIQLYPISKRTNKEVSDEY